MHTIILASAHYVLGTWAGAFAVLTSLVIFAYIGAHRQHMCANMRGVRRCLKLWEHCQG